MPAWAVEVLVGFLHAAALDGAAQHPRRRDVVHAVEAQPPPLHEHLAPRPLVRAKQRVRRQEAARREGGTGASLPQLRVPADRPQAAAHLPKSRGPVEGAQLQSDCKPHLEGQQQLLVLLLVHAAPDLTREISILGRVVQGEPRPIRHLLQRHTAGEAADRMRSLGRWRYSADMPDERTSSLVLHSFAPCWLILARLRDLRPIRAAPRCRAPRCSCFP